VLYLQQVAATTKQITATVAKDSTVKAQATDLKQLQQNVVTQTNLSGANSNDTKSAIQALVTTEEKFASVGAKDATVQTQLQSVYHQMTNASDHLVQLQRQQATLAKDGTLQQTQAQLASNVKTLHADTKAGLGANSIAVKDVKAQILAEINHIDALKAVASQITKTKDILSLDTSLANNLQKLSTAQAAVAATANTHLAALAGNTNGESTKLDAITAGVNLTKQAAAATATAATNAGNLMSGKIDAVNASIVLSKTAAATATATFEQAYNTSATNLGNFIGGKLAAVTTGVALSKSSVDTVNKHLDSVSITKLPGITTTVSGTINITVS
jgi:hypothetical protein